MDHVQNLVNILEEHMNHKQMLMDLEYIEVKLNKFIDLIKTFFFEINYHYKHMNSELQIQFQVNLVLDMLKFLN